MSALKKRLVRYCSSCSGEESVEFLIESLRTQHFRVLLAVFIASLVLFFLGVRPGTFSSTSKHLSPLGSIHRAVSYPVNLRKETQPSQLRRRGSCRKSSSERGSTG
jgi:hypothetical protein